MVAFLNDLEQAAPTIGSTLGAIGGGLLGGAVDVGTLGLAAPLVNPFTLGALGAGVGGGVGQAVENATQGPGYQQNPLKTGAESAAFDMAGGALGKGLGMVASGLGKTIAPSLVAQSGDNLSHPTAQYLADNGFTNFKDAVNFGKQVTGAPGGEGAALTNAVQDAVDRNSTNTVNLTDPFSNYDAHFGAYPGRGSAKTAITNTLQDTLNQALQDSGIKTTDVGVKGAGQNMTIPINTNALSKIQIGPATNAAKSLRNLADSASKGAYAADGSEINPDMALAAKTYNKVAQEIEDRTLGTDVSGNVAMPITDEDKQLLKETIEPLRESNPTAHANLTQKIDNAQTWADIRSAQAPFVEVSKADNALANTSAKAKGSSIAAPALGGTVGLLAGGPVGGAAGAGIGYLARQAAKSPAVESGAAKLADKTANILMRMKNLPIPAVNNAVQPLATGTAALGTAAASPQPSAAIPNQTPQGGLPMAPTATTGAAGGAPAPTVAPNIFQSLTGQAPAYLQPQALQAMMGMFDPNLMGQYSQAATTSANTEEDAQKAAAALQALEATRQQIAGSQQGGGLLGTIHNLLSRGQASPLAGGYNSQAQQLQTLLGTLGAPTQAPSLALNPQAAQSQFQAIQQFLATLGAGQPTAAPAQ